MYFLGEKVWCMWNSRYYEAKILKTMLEFDGDQYYFVHYYKFSKKLVHLFSITFSIGCLFYYYFYLIIIFCRWDMTVKEKKLLSFTKENAKLARKTNREFR